VDWTATCYVALATNIPAFLTASFNTIRYSERLAEAGIEPSVGSKGDSYDNAWQRPSMGSIKPS
jgi:hypothetical protein